MLEKPNIADERIISRLHEEYELDVAELTFLPLGADIGTAVYRVIAENGAAYFLKLRKGFEEITVTVPLFLKSQGIQEIIPPLETKSKQGWADFSEYKMILYPFIEGQGGFDRELTDEHRRILGAALRKIHSAQVPSELKRLIRKESFSPQWRERLKSFQALVENKTFGDPTATKLVDFMKAKRNEIDHLLERTEELASRLQSLSLVFVLCHTDIHGGNILIRTDGQLAEHPGGAPILYIIDWDDLILAPKERDLMFIGGGVDTIWKTEQEEAIFYKGYGKVEINGSVLAYYRYERVIEDLAIIAEQLLLTDEGGVDRERSFGWFTSNFAPGSTIEIARKTDRLLRS
jgi:spectinomycin phosphotransferase